MKVLGLIYDLVIWCYVTSIRLAFPFKRKARLWINGRKQFGGNLRSLSDTGQRVWMHCASLGEFEQGRPILEAIKQQFPGTQIILSFFSPSGYELRKDYTGADCVFYLPTDTKLNASRLVNLLQPKLVIFVKYEFWYHYMVELQQRNIPVLMISAVFREDQVFFRWYGSLYRQIMGMYDRIFVQDIQSMEVLAKVNHKQNSEVAGDTRFDRVIQITKNVQKHLLPDDFVFHSRLIVAGSTWPADEILLSQFMTSALPEYNFKIVLAPHDITERHLCQIEKLFPRIVRLSTIADIHPVNNTQILVDSIGKLASLYQYATLAFIGGGFGQGIHNILEGAVFGVPVIFGPNYSKFKEAYGLINEGGAFSVIDIGEFTIVANQLLSDESIRKAAGNAGRDFVLKGAGSTDRIMNYIQGKRFLTMQ
jgi:3-deoxy-D-manno-octulosonic-acid transferase